MAEEQEHNQRREETGAAGPGGSAGGSGPGDEEHPHSPERTSDALPTPEELEQLRSDLDEQTSRAQEYLDLAQRATADLQNLQKRLQREKETSRRLAVRDLLQDLLPCFDNLERALAAAPSAGQGDPGTLLEGVGMVHKQIQEVLRDHGVQRIVPDRREPLDPNLHEAVFRQPDAEAPEGSVLEVFETGYRLDDLVVRPARVTVSSGAPSAGQQDGTDESTEKE